MIRIPALSGRKVAVMGLGVAGLATVRALAASGAEVLAWDDTPGARERIAAEGVRPTDLSGVDWSGIDSLVLSPGIPHTFPEPHPVAAAARAAGVEIVCDVDRLGRAQGGATYVGITGTNGKSTTTALIGHILDAAGRSIEVGGNLGPAALGFKPLGVGGTYVLELSSYQLERIFSIAFDVALLLNVSADHLDRHGGMDGYIAAKTRLFDLFEGSQYAIVGIDDAASRRVADKIAQRADHSLVRISGAHRVPGGVGVENGILVDDCWDENTRIDLTAIPTLPGAHNWQNAAAAYAACRALDLAPVSIALAMRSFPGLPHRQERVATIGRVAYVNDSKATNPDAAARALSSYPRVYLIAGGRSKGAGYAEFDAFLGHVAHAYAVGEAEAEIADYFDGKAPVSRCGTLDRALAEAHLAAQSDTGADAPVVLLSPACASFDQYPNFAARGDAFRDLVLKLPETRGAA